MKKINYVNLNLKDVLICSQQLTKAQLGSCLIAFAEFVILEKKYTTTDETEFFFKCLEESLKKSESFRNKKNREEV